MAVSGSKMTLSGLLRHGLRHQPTSTLMFCCCRRQLRNKPALLAAGGAAYHSRQHTEPPISNLGVAEDSILSAALNHVPANGFTDKSLALGARDAGYLDITPNIFPDGAFSLVLFHLRHERSKLRSLVPEGETADVTKSKVLSRVKELCAQRLRGNEPVIHRWQDALALISVPSNVPASLGELAELADDVCYLSGDRSVDMEWYARRGGLAMSYAAAECYMTQDTSEGHLKTYEFLDRSLDDLREAKSTLDGFTSFFSFAGNGIVNGLRSKGFLT